MQRLLCRLMAVGALLFGGVLLAEHRLGRAVLPWEDPDPSTGAVGLGFLVLALFLLLMGEFVAVPPDPNAPHDPDPNA